MNIKYIWAWLRPHHPVVEILEADWWVLECAFWDLGNEPSAWNGIANYQSCTILRPHCKY